MNGTDPVADPIGILERTLELRSRQHERIVTNIANRDTPGYRAFEIDLAAALAPETGPGATPALVRTHEDHHAAATEAALASPSLRPVPRSPVSLRGDGNTVDLDREMARLSENALMYTAAARILSAEYARIRDAIEE